MNITNKLKNPVFVTILLVLILSSIAYLPFVTKLGYYDDDWHTIWSWKTFGAEKIREEFSIDRPFLGYVYSLELSIFGDSPITWQIWIFILRFAGSLLFYWLVSMIFPNQKLATMLMALLFSIYPGFSQMAIANTYQGNLLAVNFGIISLIFTVEAILCRRSINKVILAVLSGVFALLNVGMFEWFVGVEIVRLSVMFYLIKKKNGMSTFWQKIKDLLCYWSPAIIGILIFLYWRFFIFASLRNTTNFGIVLNSYISHPFLMLDHFFIDTLSGFYQATVVAWFGPLWQRLSSSGYYERTIGIIIGLLASFICVVVFNLWNKGESSSSTELSHKKTGDRWYVSGIFIGLISVIGTLIPATLNDRQVDITSSLSRYTLNSLTGISILLISLMFWVIEHKKIIIGIVIFLLGGSITTHFLTTNLFANTTLVQNNFWWQLSWRAPDIRNDTVFIPFLYSHSFRDIYAIFPQINLIYRPGVKSIEIQAQVLNTNTARLISSGTASDSRGFRKNELQYNYANSLISTYGNYSFPNSCVHLIDKKHLELTPNEDPLILSISQFSNYNQINLNSDSKEPSVTYFGVEPEHDWCYFFQKASLALQQSRWADIVNLEMEAQKKHLHPSDPSEWMPFFYANINQNKLDEAKSIAILLQTDRTTKSLICEQLTVLGKDNNYIPANEYDLVIDMLCD